MPVTLTVRDESTTPGFEGHTFELEFPTESITVREIIRERVYQEVDDYNRAMQNKATPSRYRGLVSPTELEEHLNGERPATSRKADWKKQFALACEAYERNGILVLVGDRQTTALDETITIARGIDVTFLRLVMLVGG